MALTPTRLALGAGLTASGAGYVYWRYWRPPVVVVGGGVMGLTTATRLATAGRRVVLIDAEHPIRGSWGLTRSSHFRMEDPVLLKMNRFSIPYWRELQKSYFSSFSDGEKEDRFFYRRTGSMLAGPIDVIEGLAATVQRELPESVSGKVEVLGPREVATRFPQVALTEDERLVYMPEGYTMLVPSCIECLKWAAQRASVQWEQDTVTGIDRKKRVITTESGRSFAYSDLVVTAGPWTNKVLASAGLSGVPLIVSNEQTVELVAKPGAPSYDWDSFPVFSWGEAGYKGRAKDGGSLYFYTTPHVPIASLGSEGVKIGFHRQGPLLDTEDFQITEAGREAVAKLPHIRKELCNAQQYDLDEFAWKQVQEFVRTKMPGLDAEKYAGYMRCLYQMTPDMNMIVGRHPEEPSIVFACGFSGSGFQFAPAIADTLSALITKVSLGDMHSSMLAKFDPKRFS